MADIDTVIADIRRRGQKEGFGAIAKLLGIGSPRLSDIMAKRRPLPDELAAKLGWRREWSRVNT